MGVFRVARALALRCYVSVSRVHIALREYRSENVATPTIVMMVGTSAVMHLFIDCAPIDGRESNLRLSPCSLRNLVFAILRL